jgi:hypothetical protein
METIELEEGWLIRQMQEARREFDNWPEVKKRLATINESLVHQPTASGTKIVQNSNRDTDLNQPSDK